MTNQSPEQEWDIVCACDFDLAGLVNHLIHIGRNYYNTEHPDSLPEFIEHHRNTGGDSGIANWVIRLDSSFNKTPEELIESSNQLLSLTHEELIAYMAENHLDIRRSWIEPAKDTPLGSYEQFYHWNCIFHNGEEYELIHMAIILKNDQSLRERWARVLSAAFQKARPNS